LRATAFACVKAACKHVDEIDLRTLTSESNSSGEAMLIVDIPTGYW